jgi:outer membrane protein assembly factor BamB
VNPVFRKTIRLTTVAILLIGCSLDRVHAQNWPTFRGKFARGVADDQALPEEWDIKTGKNIRWRTEIPGMGHSSPVIWGDRVFLTSAVAEDIPGLVLGDQGGIDMAKDSSSFSWRLYCLDKTSGKILWSKETFEGKPRAARHVKSSQANSTPATNGKVVAAIFGSQGMAVYDFDGNRLWQNDLGVLDPGLFGDASSQWGHASSPIIDGDKVIVQVDRHKNSFLAAYKIDSGELIWKVDRDEKPTWATPTLRRVNGNHELIVVGGDFDRGIDPGNGREIWRFRREYQVKTTTPVVAEGRIVLSGGYRGKPLFALKTGQTGDLSPAEGQETSDAVAWVSGPGGPYTSSPVVYKGVVYFVRNNGILAALDLQTGAEIFRHRLGGNFSASPVASDGKLYFVSEEGVATVIRAAREVEILARNDMAEPCMATPAISGKTIFIRGQSHVYAIGTGGLHQTER